MKVFYLTKLIFVLFFLNGNSPVCFGQSPQTREKRWETVKSSFSERNTIVFEIYEWALHSGKINSSVLLPVKRGIDSLNHLLEARNNLNVRYLQQLGRMDSSLVFLISDLRGSISEDMSSGNSVRLLALLDRAERELRDNINAYNRSLTDTDKKDLFYNYKTNP